MAKRSTFATRFGAIATVAGSAIGLGNVWRFPYEMGSNGGGSYFLVYVLSILLIGIPVMLSELAIGYSTRKSANKALRELSPGTRWHYFSLGGFLSAMLTLAFYSVVAGWIMAYFGAYLLEGVGQDSTAYFQHMVSTPLTAVGFTMLVLLLNHIVLRLGVRQGVERVNGVLMPLLFVLMIIFAVRSLFLPAAREGLTFMFRPSLSAFSPSMVLNAMGQAFFTLSLGGFVLETYASYFRPETSLVRTSLLVAIMDTAVALLSGVFLFPALFTYGGEVAAGPPFIFEVLPRVFASMPGGEIIAPVFFFLLLSAALTSTISMSEVQVSVVEEQRHWSRRRATIWVTLVALVLGSLCALSFSVLSSCTLWGRNIFGVMEYAVSNLLMPFMGLFICWFVGWHLQPDFLSDIIFPSATRQKYPRLTGRVAAVMRFLLRYIAPLCILAVFMSL